MNRKIYFVMITFMVCVLCSCGLSETDPTTGQALEQTEIPSDMGENAEGKTAEPKEHEGFKLQITTNPEEEIVIPDPSEVAGVAEVILYQNNEYLNMDNTRGSETRTYDREDNPTVSLPFLNLEKEIYVINWAVGSIGEKEPQEITVNYQYTEEQENRMQEKTVQGNCLVLSLCSKQSEENYDYEDKYTYLAVLDYENGTSYITQTGIYEDQQDQLNLCDITGDGQDEMIVSGVANKWIVWQVFQLSEGKWKEIKSDFYDTHITDNYTGNSSNYIFQAFEGEFTDDTNIKVWCKDEDVNFEKKWNVEDIVKEVEADDAYVKTVAVRDEFIMDEEGDYYYSFFQNMDPESGICFELNVYACKAWLCGKIKAYVKYDKTTDKMKITKVKSNRARDKE